ncbi:MAG: hypothetical protein WCY37_04260 [Candidatus Dojkabacteria bacterium]
MDYLLDGKRVPWQHIIRVAKRHGYKGKDGIFLTSEAADVLRAFGYSVDTCEE